MSDKSQRKSEQIGRQQRGQDGRVQSLYADSELYEIVGQAARRARPDAPETLSLREFDRTLTSLGFPDAPSGRAIYGRLKRPWAEIVETGLKPPEERALAERVRGRREESPWLTGRHVFYAINKICMWKQLDTLDEREYDRLLDAYIAEHASDASEQLHLEELLPTSGQILAVIAKEPVTGTSVTTPPWSKVLLYCGRPPYAQAYTNAMPLPEAIDLYIEATAGTILPTSDEIVRMAREWNVSVKTRETGKRWESYLDETRALRAERGLDTPTTRPDPKELPLLVRPQSLIAQAQQPGRGAWKDEEKVFAVLAVFVLDHQAKGELPTRARYLGWRKGRQAPSPSAIERYRPFSEWINLTEERLLAAKKAA